MKKIQTGMKKYRKILILTSVLTASVVFLPGCDLFTSKQPFSDAFYTSNFIEGIGFDVFEGGNATIPAAGSDPVTGAWDFAYRYQDWDGYDYITRTAAGIASGYLPVPAGLSSTAPVYRVDLVNLIDGGDFESGLGGSWSVSGSGTFTPTANTSMYANNHMVLNSPVTTGSVIYAPQLLGSPDLDQTFISYFRYSSSVDGFYTQINGGPKQDFTVASKQLVKRSFAAGGLAPSFTFSPIQYLTFANVKVDNFRMTRSGNMELRLFLKSTETIPELESGVYSLSVWVHTDDITASLSQEPYQMDTFRLSMRPNLPFSSLSAQDAIYTPVSGWQKIQAVLSTSALQFSTTTKPVLELVLSFNDSRPGRVLLAQPELRFYPDYPSGL